MDRISSSVVSTQSESQLRASAYVRIVDDNLFRDLEQAETMDLSVVKRAEAITKRAVKSKWFYRLTGWVDKINGGPGEMGPSPTGRMTVMKAKENSKDGREKRNGSPGSASCHRVAGR